MPDLVLEISTHFWRENAMTIVEAKKQIENIRKLREQVKTDPELAKRLLDRTGMYTPTGKLKKQFS